MYSPILQGSVQHHNSDFRTVLTNANQGYYIYPKKCSPVFLPCLHAHLNTIVVPVQFPMEEVITVSVVVEKGSKKEDNILGLDIGEAPLRRCIAMDNIQLFRVLRSR